MKFRMKEDAMTVNLTYGDLDISGDETKGFRPFQLMMASIVGCSGSVFRKILEKQRTELEDLQISSTVERNALQANRIEKITLHYIIKGYHLDAEKINRNLELSRKNCSMIQSVQDTIQIEETVELIELSS
ncbi:MAG TPA: OsmC family protein [Candidatus Avamphibacillus intestinigallinarum]|nr:OsmC family protein [Candidatus Avamphibacillus intestinigallinarum]